MLQYERFENILNELNEKSSVKVTKLAEKLDTSESTIRRDIVELDKMGKLRRVFGGAVLVENRKSIDLNTRAGMMISEKQKIAEYAVAQINSSDFVYIDAGTATGAMIDLISEKGATYVTNGLEHGRKLAAKGFNVYMIQGRIRTETQALVGQVAVDGISRYNFTKCFMGVDAIDKEHGLTTLSIDEAKVKSEAMNHSNEVFILADSSKFNQVASVCFGDITSGTIITDHSPEGEYGPDVKFKVVS